MPQQSINHTPAKNRFPVILITTSVISVVFLLLAVYNASRELERIHEIDNLHRFASAQLARESVGGQDFQHLLKLAAPGYRVMITRGQDVLVHSATTDLATVPRPIELEATRLNAHGGYLEDNGQSLTWTQVPLPGDGAQLFLLHDFTPSGLGSLVQVYAQRLLVPAAFYVWLMYWMSRSLRFLTDKLSRQKLEMEHMALHDALSGLPNRNLLNDRLAKMVVRSKRHRSRFALAVIDLDDFKTINDSLGHDAGDTLLQAIADRLRGCIRSVDTVARVGGDEFVLLLEGLDTHSSREIFDRTSTEIARPVRIRDTDVQVRASIGVAVFPDDGDDAETLTRNADQAMYAVKAKGGGVCLYGSVSTPEKPQRPQSSAVTASAT